jgi:hypothetical protein
LKMSAVWVLDPVERWSLVYMSARVHSPQSHPFHWSALVWYVTVVLLVDFTMSSYLVFRMGSRARRGSEEYSQV